MYGLVCPSVGWTKHWPENTWRGEDFLLWISGHHPSLSRVTSRSSVCRGTYKALHSRGMLLTGLFSLIYSPQSCLPKDSVTHSGLASLTSVNSQDDLQNMLTDPNLWCGVEDNNSLSSKIHLKRESSGAGMLAYWIGALAAVAEAQSSVLSTHGEWLTTSCSSSSVGPNTHSDLQHLYPCAHTQTSK